jgi:hypothetical protein
MRFMVFSVGGQWNLKMHVASSSRTHKMTGADGTREKTHFYFLSIVAPADGIKAAN